MSLVITCFLLYRLQLESFPKGLTSEAGKSVLVSNTLHKKQQQYGVVYFLTLVGGRRKDKTEKSYCCQRRVSGCIALGLCRTPWCLQAGSSAPCSGSVRGQHPTLQSPHSQQGSETFSHLPVQTTDVQDLTHPFILLCIGINCIRHFWGHRDRKKCYF